MSLGYPFGAGADAPMQSPLYSFKSSYIYNLDHRITLSLASLEYPRKEKRGERRRRYANKVESGYRLRVGPLIWVINSEGDRQGHLYKETYSPKRDSKGERRDSSSVRKTGKSARVIRKLSVIYNVDMRP